MAKIKTITGLDIGSNAIKLLVATKEEDGFRTLFYGEEPSLGVRKGVVVDVERVSRTIQILLDRARTETGQKIDGAYININGSHLFCSLSQGMVAVSRADRNVSKEDVDRVLQEAANAFSLPSNNEIFETFLKEFTIDGLPGIKSAEGLQGGRLETEVLVLAGFSPYRNNLTQAVANANLHVLDITASPLADAAVVLSQKQKELGVAVLNIGAGTSELAVFEEGELIHLAVFPVGSANITSDIAIGLKTDIDIAEAIKVKLAKCVLKESNKKEKVEIEGEETLVFSQKTLNSIVNARVSEIFKEVQKELKKINKQNLLPSGIVLTGGGSKLPKIVEIAKKEFKLPCRLGKVDSFVDTEGDLALTTVCGLVALGWDTEVGETFKKDKVVIKGICNKIKKLFKVFLP